MALKGQKTKADFIEWEAMKSLILKLERDNDFKFSRLIATGCFLGLRISDILSLKWSDVMGKELLLIVEKKTKKERKISIHNDLKDLLKRHYNELLPSQDEFLFVNRYGIKPISVQYVNMKLKEIFKKYKIAGSYSSHSFRKTLGRQVWKSNNYSERSLILLSELFSHANVSTTKIYLGIQEEAIKNLYLSL